LSDLPVKIDKMNVRNTAFTLIEMLVVLAIIGVVASLVLPTASRAKRKAREVVCINNLRNIRVAMQLYQNDNGSRFPLGVTLRDAVGTRPKHLTPKSKLYFFENALFGQGDLVKLSSQPPSNIRPLTKYLSSNRTGFCPEDRGWDLRLIGGPITKSQYELIGCSYSYNWGDRIPTDDGWSWYLGGQRDSWVDSPSKFVLMYERPARPFPVPERNRYIAVYWHRARKSGSQLYDSPNPDPDKSRGPRASPLLFVDGHAEFKTYTGTWTINDKDNNGFMWTR
jgi:prepilin-type N-terminal cleavage/methylation domain-containing protein